MKMSLKFLFVVVVSSQAAVTPEHYLRVKDTADWVLKAVRFG